ncbi:MAG: GNAT family N-acetyltransferase [Betaproteobacteria bacterium]|nr:GNAT family N-acetyltransferase [Betaproteobacteria bacterium]
MMREPDLHIRPLVRADQSFLWDILHVALWDPPPAPLRPREVLDSPGVRIYAENWGRVDDIGVVGELPNVAGPIGACWMRVVPDKQGLAHIDDATPQLGIALLPAFQGKGYGHQLMLAALDAARKAGMRQVSLTVHPDNPAIAMYQRCGFRRWERPMLYHLMVATL